MTQSSVAERLRNRNQRTIYGHIETGETTNDPPAGDAPDRNEWLPFVIRRINPDEVTRDGWMLAYAAHEMEKYAEQRLGEANEARTQFESTRPPARKGKPHYQPPALPTEALSEQLLRREGEKLAILQAGLVDPEFKDVQGALGPLEGPLVDAIVNFSGVKPTGENASAS